MSKKLLLSLGLILSLVIAFALWIAYSPSVSIPSWEYKETQIEPSYTEIAAEKQTQHEQDTTLYNQAIADSDLATCETIASSSQKLQCNDMVKSAIALTSLDPEPCNTLSNTGMTDRCRDNVIYRMAETKNDRTLCAELSDANIRNTCTDLFAEAQMKEAIASGTLSGDTCTTLSSTGMQEQCQARIQIEADNRIYRDAMSSKSLEKCDEITSPDM